MAQSRDLVLNRPDFSAFLQNSAVQLARAALPGLRDLAMQDRIGSLEAALRAIKLATFHRAAEVYLARPVRAHNMVRSVLRSIKMDETLCRWLAEKGPQHSGAEWGAFAYTQLLSPTERRARGQFFTPPHIADFMTAWAIRSPRDRILDPGTGPGILLVHAYKHLSRLGSAEPAAQLEGVEISSLAPTFAALSLAPDTSANPRIVRGDFLTDFNRSNCRYDAIVGNPPYSRHQVLNAQYKRRINVESDTLLGEHVSLRAGIYVHFLIRSIDLLRDGGRLAFLTPREILDAQYGFALRRFLLSTTRLRALIVFDPSNGSAFEDALTTSVIILLEHGTPDGTPIRIVHVQGSVTSRDLMNAVSVRTPPRGFAWGWCIDVSPTKLVGLSRWSAGLSAEPDSEADGGDVPLGELVGIKRGIATGANRFFVLSESEVKAAELPRKFLRPVIARARLASGYRITPADFSRWRRKGERVWLLDVRETPSGTVRRYLEMGRRAGLSKRYLCQHRKIWYQMERRPVPPIIVTYMSRDAPRFIRNDARVVPVNVFHAIYPKGLSRYQMSRLLNYLNSAPGHEKLRCIVRTYGSGLMKIEPKELLSVRVPDVRSNRRS